MDCLIYFVDSFLSSLFVTCCIMDSNGSQVVPQDDAPNLTSDLSHMVCPMFKKGYGCKDPNKYSQICNSWVVHICVNDLHLWKFMQNLYKCVICFFNEEFMQKKVNVLDSQSFKFCFWRWANQKWRIVPKKQFQSFEMHHNSWNQLSWIIISTQGLQNI